MEFKFCDFAAAGSGNICINDLTVVFGPNNSGKTYINYAIYSILQSFQKLFDFGLKDAEIKKMVSELKKTGTARIVFDKLETKFTEFRDHGLKITGSKIKNFFQQPSSNFRNSQIQIKLNDIEVSHNNSLSCPNFNEIINVRYSFEVNNWIMNFTVDKEDPAAIIFFKNISIPRLKSKIIDLIFQFHFKDVIPFVFAITSERTGISVFHKAYDFINNHISKSAEQCAYFGANKDIDLHSLHALPIADNIDFVRHYENISKEKSFFTKSAKKYNYVLDVLTNLLDNGKFKYKNGLIYYTSNFGRNNSFIPIYATSSSVKSLFLFDLFIKHCAYLNYMLIIDEPELNLSAVKQVEMARLIARLVNSGIRVLTTTNSDYFVREINNLVTLSSLSNNPAKMKLMEEFDIHEKDLLEKSKVSAFKSNVGGDLENVRVLDTGIDPGYWDDIIVPDNTRSHKIFKESVGIK